jgi:type I restriction enzyme, S subunit
MNDFAGALVLYTLVGVALGRPVLLEDSTPFCVQRHIGILRPAATVPLDFLVHLLTSQFVYKQALACATGTGQKTVPLSGLRRLLIPVPPVAEQMRIVAKVNELMAVCDGLEAALARTQRERGRLLEALLHEALDEAASQASTANVSAV